MKKYKTNDSLGSKIENLMILADHNIRVPKFVYIRQRDAFRGEIQYYGLENKTLEEQCQILKKRMTEQFVYSDADIPKFKKYAVRSSCNLEDNEHLSFAGQFDSFLFVDRNDIADKSLKCLLSLYSDRSIEYMKLHNINVKSLRMNLIVQEMIDADYSGVVFTANPQGILNEMVISMSKGIGENVVQDKGSVTNCYYNTTDNTYNYDGEKLIDDAAMYRLMNIIKRIQVLMGKYLDIEFAIKGQDIYILQCRPITTINVVTPNVFDNSNIVESYPGTSFPLTISFAKYVYSTIFKNLFKRVLNDSKKIDQYSEIFNNMVGDVNGRLYYKINNWYEMIKFLPMSDKIISIWQEMLGVTHRTYNRDSLNVSLFEKTRICKNFAKELRNSQISMEELNRNFSCIYDGFKQQYNKNLSNKDIIELFKDVESSIFFNWDITLINDMYAFIYTYKLKKKLRLTEKETDINNEIANIANIESLKPIKLLMEIAIRTANGKDCEELKKQYIDLYGDRVREELKLETHTFRTNPELLDRAIDEFAKNVENTTKMYNQLCEPNEETYCKDNKLREKCCSGIINREVSRLNRTRIFGMVRTMFLHIGENLEKEKIIKDKQDVFFLTMDELFDIALNGSNDCIDKIEERKEKYKIFEETPSYSRIVFSGEEFDIIDRRIKNEEEKKKKDTLYGTPSSSGKVTGEVVVLSNTNEQKDVDGKIIVTKMTDPGWVFLIAKSKGILIEKGSLLSHTAIVSRELHIPSIVGINNLLTNLKDGDIVEIDGTTGIVEVKSRKED